MAESAIKTGRVRGVLVGDGVAAILAVDEREGALETEGLAVTVGDGVMRGSVVCVAETVIVEVAELLDDPDAVGCTTDTVGDPDIVGDGFNEAIPQV